MARRITRKPLKRNAVVASRIGWLPGALFLGAVHREERSQRSIVKRHEENVEYAERLQQIREDYEADGLEEALWEDLRLMGFDSGEISRCAANPAAITGCLFVGAGMKPPVDLAKLYVDLDLVA
jgi:hypothetical protein